MSFEEEEEDRKSHDRQGLRWNIPVPVYVKGVLRDGTEFSEETITSDASPSGMCILLSLVLHEGDQVTVKALEERFESSATVRHVSPLGTGMNRIRITFPKSTRFTRDTAAKKYIYDYYREDWVGYMLDNVYYNTKHEPFGKVENNKILSLASGAVLFSLDAGRAYDTRGNCIGHII